MGRSSEILPVIDGIYAASLDSSLWQNVLVDIAEFCAAETASLVVNDSGLGLSSVTCPRVDPAVVEAYTIRWWAHDPTSIATATSPVGLLTTLETTGAEDFLRSDFHNQFWARSGLGAHRVAANLVLGEGVFASCVVHAAHARDETTERNHERFAVVVPHLIRAIDIQRRLWRLEIDKTILRNAGSAACDGLLLVDGDMRVIFADRNAESLARYEGVKLTRGTFTVDERLKNTRLCELVASCVAPRGGEKRGGSVQIGSGLRVDVLPLGDDLSSLARYDPAGRRYAAILAFTDVRAATMRRSRRLQTRFALTPTEAVLALEVAEGGGREAVASRLGISVTTARTHLTRIYEKTGTTRQAELVRLLMDGDREP